MLFKYLLYLNELLAWETTVSLPFISPLLFLKLFNLLFEFWMLLNLNSGWSRSWHCINFKWIHLAPERPQRVTFSLLELYLLVCFFNLALTPLVDDWVQIFVCFICRKLCLDILWVNTCVLLLFTLFVQVHVRKKVRLLILLLSLMHAYLLLLCINWTICWL